MSSKIVKNKKNQAESTVIIVCKQAHVLSRLAQTVFVQINRAWCNVQEMPLNNHWLNNVFFKTKAPSSGSDRFATPRQTKYSVYCDVDANTINFEGYVICKAICNHLLIVFYHWSTMMSLRKIRTEM